MAVAVRIFQRNCPGFLAAGGFGGAPRPAGDQPQEAGRTGAHHPGRDAFVDLPPAAPRAKLPARPEGLIPPRQAQDPRYFQTDKPPLHAEHWIAITGKPLSATAGALAGNASEDDIARIRRFGEKIGWAFQVVDDIPDVEASTEQMGKRTGTARAHGKNTYPGLLGLKQSWALARELDRGGQTYFVHNRIETIEAIAARVRRLAPRAGPGPLPPSS